MVHVLILDLKTDNGDAFYIFPGTSLHNLGHKLVIVSNSSYVWLKDLKKLMKLHLIVANFNLKVNLFLRYDTVKYQR